DRQQFFAFNRLPEKGDCAGFYRTFFEIRLFTAGNDDDGSVSPLYEAAQPFDEAKAVPQNAAPRDVRRETDVEQDQIGLLLPHHADGVRTVNGGDRRVTVSPQFCG